MSVPLFADLNALHHAIATAQPRAQQYFDQGVRFKRARSKPTSNFTPARFEGFLVGPEGS